MKRLALAAALVLAGCGSSAPPRPTPAHPDAKLKALAVCPNVPIGQGRPGACTPDYARQPVQRTLGAQAGTQICDLSNNDPVGDFRPLARHGIRACWFKSNEGTGFTDRTLPGMVKRSRAAGLAPGGYDFVREYNSHEAYKFVGILKANGICRSKNTLPPALDVEAGHAYRGGVQTMVNIVNRECGRVSIYTGLWYWNPYLGNFWPGAASAWISGYPRVVGRANYPFVAVHQFTDKGSLGGGHSGDLSRWEGHGSFSAYIGQAKHRKPKPKPCRASCKRAHKLAHLRQQRTVLRRLIAKHRCHAPHGAHYKACKRWLAEGKQVNRRIHSLGGK